MGVDVISAPVLGTHNDKMVIDFANIVPAIQPTEEQQKQIHSLTAGGGSAVAKDIIAKTGEKIKQTAFLATAAATVILVEALVGKEPVKLPVSCHGKVSGATLGRMCDVSESGAVVTHWEADVQKGRDAFMDARGAMQDLAAAKAASQKSSLTLS